jgi:hypothetical protein
MKISSCINNSISIESVDVINSEVHIFDVCSIVKVKRHHVFHASGSATLPFLLVQDNCIEDCVVPRLLLLSYLVYNIEGAREGFIARPSAAHMPLLNLDARPVFDP